MAELRTVPEALERAAIERPDGDFTFVTEDLTEQRWSFTQLLEGARGIAAGLAARGMNKGDRVALVLPTAGDFVPTFLGVVQGGGVPVPLYPPMGLGQLGGYLDHAQHIVGAARASYCVTTPRIKAVLGKLHGTVPELREMLLPDDIRGDASEHEDPGLSLDDPCFIQFTSGSTSKPKGVTVTHANLAHNCNCIMRDGLATDETDRGVSWLPLFHDMGLIGFVLAPIHHEVPVTFLSPLSFLKRPVTWLEYLSKHRGTITYGPNFAYAISTKRIRDEDVEGLDLSCVRIAGCGAEPIQAETLRSFAERFGRHGFRQEAFIPSYGMAEHTLAIAFSTGVPTDVVKAETLWGEGKAEPAGQDGVADDVVEIVGCGEPFPNHEIRIVDPESRAVLSDRTVGEIELRGPSVMPGYFDNQEATDEVLDAEGWLRTGDLGYLVDGQLFICGRQKDVLIVHGKNYYPQDLEWAASEVEGIRAGNVVAFSTYREGLGREAIVMLAETREKDGRDRLAKQAKQAIQRALGLAVDEVHVVDAGSLPKTSSGKVQRAKARTQFEGGELGPKKAEGAANIARHVVESQLSHLRLRIFGPRGKR